MRYYFIIRILVCSFLTFSQIYSKEAQIQEKLQKIFALDQNSELSENTIEKFVEELQSIDSSKLADSLFSKNKSALERFLANPQVQARASYNSVSGGREGNGIASLLQSYYKEKVANIMQPTFSGDKLQALKNLCANSTSAVREAIQGGLYNFIKNPIVQNFKEYLKNSDNFRTTPTESSSASQEPRIESQPIEPRAKLPDLFPTDTNENEDMSNEEGLEDPNPEASIDDTLKQIQKLLQRINAPIAPITPTPEDPTTPADRVPAENTAPSQESSLEESLDSIGVSATVWMSRKIIEDKLRNLFGTLAVITPHLLKILQKPTGKLVGAFINILRKDQNKLAPLEYAIKHSLALLSNIVTIVDTATPAQRDEVALALERMTPLLGSMLRISEKRAINDFYVNHFTVPVSAEQQEAFAISLKKIEATNGVASALELFKGNLKDEYSDQAPQLFQQWKNTVASQGKIVRIMKSLAFIIKHPDITREVFKKPWLKKVTSATRKQTLMHEIEKYNIGKAKTEQISVDDFTDPNDMWSEFENIHGYISLGKFVIKARNVAFSMVNLFRKATGRSPRDFEELEYENATEMTQEINKSWIKTLVRGGSVLFRTYNALRGGLRAVSGLVVRVENSRVYAAAAKASELTLEGMRMAYNSSLVQAAVKPIERTIRYYWDRLALRTKALFTRDTTVAQSQEDPEEETLEPVLEQGQEPDIATTISTAAQEIAPDETDEQEATGVTAALISYVTSAVSEAGASFATAGRLLTRVTATSHKAAPGDKPFTRDETANIIAESLVRQLMEQIEAREKKAGLITDEEKQKQYEEAREALIEKNVASMLDEVRAQIDQGQQPQGLIARYLPVFLGGQKKLTDDEYLKLFNEILETKIGAITETLTGEFDALEGTTKRDTKYLKELVRTQVQEFFDEKEAAIFKTKGALETSAEGEYEALINKIIEENAASLLEAINELMQAKKVRLSDAGFIARFNELLQEQITTLSQTLSDQFESINARQTFKRTPFEDSVEVQPTDDITPVKPTIKPDPVRILPEEESTAQKGDVTTYERAAYDRLFTAPGASDTPSSFQKALKGCIPPGEESSPLATLLGFTIESTLLQSDSYRAELQSTGVRSFSQGLDSGNNVTRLVNGASSLNILKLAAKTAKKDLDAVIKAARIAGVLAHDSLVEDFFSTYCENIQPDEKKDLLKIMTSANPKFEELIPYLKPEYQQNADKLFSMLQHHLELPARMETPLFFLEHQQAITECLKKSKRPDYAQDIFEKLDSTVPLEKIRAMLPALQEYNKAMNFFNGRRIQFVKSLSYKLKNFFQLMTRGVKVINYKRNTFNKTLSDFKLAVEGSWVSGLKASSLPDAITQPQQTTTDDLLKFISENQPEKNPSAAHPAIDEEQVVMEGVTTMMSDVARETRSTDVIHLFLQGLTGLESKSTEASYQNSYSTISDYINGTSLEATIPLGKLINAMAPTKLTDPTIRARALCGIVLLNALKGNSTANLSRDTFAELTNTLYNKVAKGETLTFEEFSGQLEQISSDDINRMITDAMNDNLDISEGSPHSDPLAGLDDIRPRSGSTGSVDSFKSSLGDTTEQVHEGDDDQFHDTLTEEELEAERRKKEEELREKQHQQELLQEKQNGAERPGSRVGTGEIIEHA